MTHYSTNLIYIFVFLEEEPMADETFTRDIMPDLDILCNSAVERSLEKIQKGKKASLVLLKILDLCQEFSDER